jgi:L,D-peptidoglycan transpeptidase YkuD (ErfK/YbiS/YcfS/YnhG family)
MQVAGESVMKALRGVTAILFAIAVLIPVPASANNSTSISAAATITPVPDSEWAAILAANVWRSGCPVNQTQLRRVEINFHGFDGAIHRGALVVRADVASSVVRIFTRLFDVRFPIRRMTPIETYHGDDNSSMAADNTSAFNCRRASQANASDASSPHANGRAIDVNPAENPWVDPRCKCFRPSSKYSGLAKAPRTGPGVITNGGVAWRAFTAEGWLWQDNSTIDYQHFDTGYPSRPLLPTAFPVPVDVGNSSQIITVKAFGTLATVTAWTKSSTGWHAVFTTTAGHIGSKGLTDGRTRHQNTYTTPSGTYPINQAFGIRANPGTALPYRVLTKNDWWVEDNKSAYYNTLRAIADGGFDTSLPETNVNGSEQLITHTGLYDYALVIDYNMQPAIPYRGAGIFLHVSNGRPTAGCVSVPKSTLVALLRWITPNAHPRIAIG